MFLTIHKTKREVERSELFHSSHVVHAHQPSPTTPNNPTTKTQTPTNRFIQGNEVRQYKHGVHPTNSNRNCG
jgi:hypothetical protein